jgi:hypothetical protein
MSGRYRYFPQKAGAAIWALRRPVHDLVISSTIIEHGFKVLQGGCVASETALHCRTSSAAFCGPAVA